ncbi:MAG: long-chain-fatty-acid--CoA ligase [Chloroflexi bacterium]|nr:long-chain-fatty-acid--CoA ligase [Chloroflexota bacterium]
MNTLDFLTITGSICPDRPAVLFEGKRHTYADINESSNRLANALIALGLGKGDSIAMLQVNSPEVLQVYYATAKIGGIFVPLNFRAKEDEIAYLLQHSEAKVLFVGDRYIPLVESIRDRAPGVKHFISIWTKAKDMVLFDDFMASGSPEDVFTPVDDNDVSLLLYTAGTTGKPKGVPITHNSFGVYVLGNVDPPDPDKQEVNLLTVPLYHVAGFQGLLSAIYGGRTVAMMRQFEVKEWMDTVQKEKANRAMLVPTMLKRVIDDPDFAKYDLSSLKVITYGAASMPFDVIKKAIQVMPKVRFINAFGQTETASTITTLGTEDHVIEGTEEQKAKKLRRLASSIGKPLPDVEIAIMGEDGKLLPTGQVGEIVARGPRVMAGYWKDPEKTAKALSKDGWLHTNDVGWMDEEGYIYLSGRGDDMIIRGGENISPEEVEQVIQAHPAVEEVAVIAVPDQEYGQQPRACVALKKGAKATQEEIIEFTRTRLSSFKRPRTVVFMDELPRNAMGKVLRKACREKYGQA